MDASDTPAEGGSSDRADSDPRNSDEPTGLETVNRLAHVGRPLRLCTASEGWPTGQAPDHPDDNPRDNVRLAVSLGQLSGQAADMMWR